MALVEKEGPLLKPPNRRNPVLDPSVSSSSEYASTFRPSPLGLALLRVAGGDAAVLDALRAMAWAQYRDAGFPCGPDEEGMEQWWNERLASFQN